MEYAIESLCGYPEEAIVAFASEATGNDPTVDELLSVAVVDVDGTCLLSSLLRPEHHESWPEAERRCRITPALVRLAPVTSALGEDMERLLAGERLIIVFDARYDLNIAMARVPQLENASLHLFSLRDEFAKVHGAVESLADIAERYGLSTSFPDAIRRAETLAASFRALMRDQEYIRHMAELLFGVYDPDDSEPMACIPSNAADETTEADGLVTNVLAPQGMPPSDNASTDERNGTNGNNTSEESIVDVPLDPNPGQIDPKQGRKVSGKIVVVATAIIALFLVIFANTLGSGPTKEIGDDNVRVSEDGAKTYTFYDSVILKVPSSWRMEEGEEDVKYLYGDDGSYAFFNKVQYKDEEPIGSDTFWNSTIDGIENGIELTVDRDNVTVSNVGDAVRHRYPISYDDGENAYGGYMDLIASGSTMYYVSYAFPDSASADVRDIVLPWLDSIEYLNMQLPGFFDTTWIDDEVSADTTTYTFEGLSVSLPSTWHSSEDESDDDTFYHIRNAHGCYAVIMYSRGEVSENESFEAAVSEYRKEFEDGFTIDPNSLAPVEVGAAKGFRLTVRGEDGIQAEYFITYEVLFSGDDVYAFSIAVPVTATDAYASIVSRSLESITLKDAKWPIFKHDVHGKQKQATEVEKTPAPTQTQSAPSNIDNNSNSGTPATTNTSSSITDYINSSEFTRMRQALDDACDDLMGLLSSGDASEVDSRITSLRSALNDFKNVNAPDECAGLRDSYIQACQNTISGLEDIYKILTTSGDHTALIEDAKYYFDLTTACVTNGTYELDRLKKLM